MLPFSEALLERLKNRQAVLVAGMGSAELAALPGWKAVATALAERATDDGERQAVVALIESGQLATAMSILRATVSPETVVEVLQGLFPVRGQAPEAIQALADAPWRGIIDTGLDSVWAAALAAAPDLSGRMVFASSASALESGHGRFLLQLFGRPDVPSSLCLAPFEMGAAVVATGAAKFIEGLHKKWSFVFVGFSPSDPDLAMLGRIVAGSPSTLEHFYVAPGMSTTDARRVKAEYGLTVVSVDASLEETLKELAAACQAAGNKPTVEDVEAWLERLTADPDDQEAQAMLDQGLAKLHENQEWERLVAAHVSRAEIEPDAKDQAADLYEAATILEKELGAADRAYPVALMALHLTPHDSSLLNDAKQIADKAGLAKEFLEELRQIEKQAADPAELGALSLGVARMLAADPARQEEAIAAYQKLVDRDPGNAEAMASLESLLHKAERWDRLGELYQSMLERDPGNAHAQSRLEEVYQRTQKIPQLIEVLQARVAHSPDDNEARKRLEDLYEENQRWQPLAAMYERRLEKDPDDREIQNKLIAIYHKTQQWQPLGVLLERDLAKNPDSAEALGKVEALYRKSEQWRPLADLLERRAERREPAGARALRLERAMIFIDRLKEIDAALAVGRSFAASDASAAEEIYGKCLDRDPGNANVLLALSDLAASKGDHLRAAKFILDATERTQNPLELGRLFTEAGSIYLDHIADPAKAAELFHKALAADPEQTAAAGRLLAIKERAEDWAGAEPLIELLVRKAPGEGKVELLQRQAQNARKLGKTDKAATAIAAASKLDRGSAKLALEHADILFEQQSWEEARAEYLRARELLGDKAAGMAALSEKLGECSTKMNDLDAAIRYYQEALAITPDARKTLETLVELHASREQWKEHVELKRKLLAHVDGDGERARILDEIGDVWQEKLSDWPAAMTAYREALQAQPERRQTLYKTLDFYTQERQWPEALEALQKLAALETEPAGRAKLAYAMAAIHRDELGDSEKALELFSNVLDQNPLYPKAFEAIEKLLRNAKDWEDLERAYREQISRLPEDAPTEVKLRLFDALAEVTLKLHDKESTAVTLEAAAALEPANVERRERLAGLYFSMGPAAADKAIASHQALLARQPTRLDSYKALAALFFQTGAHDKMWCVAGAMTCLGKADPPLRALYENYRPTQTGATPGKLTGELWQKVVHPDENASLSALFALLSPALAMTTAQSHKTAGFDRNTRIDAASGNWSYAAALRYVASTIEAPLPEVYVRRDLPATVTLVNLKDKNILVPSLVVGLGFDQLSSQSQVVFDLAKRMVGLRPERFPRFALGTASALDTAVRAALQLGGSPVEPGEHKGEVDRMAKQLDEALPAPMRTELKVLARKYVESCGGQIDVGGWFVASDLTASRAALAICGDVGAAARVLALEPTGQSPMPIADRISDLLAYFISEDHFAVRAALGLQVNLNPAPAPAPQPTRRMSHMQIKTEG
jgi:tetratricopeptide (TPR) repeat protein